ncbi:ABC-type transport auxiliary lipoprotein family protein [Hydrogenophaga sp.]|uniref:ABC-type transport auxiliary lipoprotein family protein n=1 Tax=Hydrogenophaga sp. TaxID=1904254 RepID=UPI0025BBB0AF|nr:ABC-type transport auxiliary lipoprotein family protein [Hydrogenophaga sp.]
MPLHTDRSSAIPWTTQARRLAAAAAALALSACAVTQAPAPKLVYDFGPAAPVASNPAVPALAPLALAEVQTSVSLDTTAVQFRLTYANAQELRPYALARWSMPPGQLLQQRVRAVLTSQGPVLSPGEGSPAYALKLELEEFSQQFDAPNSSQGVVQLRATLLKGNELSAQRSFTATAPAPTADAPGGVRALTAATQDAATQIAAWLAQSMP